MVKEGHLLKITGLLIVLFSTIALSLTVINTFTTGINNVLVFDANSERNVSVEMWGDSYVRNVSFGLTGMLSDWEIKYFYNNTGTSPVDAQYVNSNKWIVSDISSGIFLIDPTNGNIYDSYSKSNLYDAEWITDTKWFYVDYDADKVVLFDASTNTEISSFGGLNNPEAADYINDTKWLVADTGNNRIRLISNNVEIKNYTNSISKPVDVLYINDEEWVLTSVSGMAGKVVHVNSTSNSIIKEYTGFSSSIRSVDVVYQNSEEYWLISDSTAGVYLINMTSGLSSSYPNNIINNYTDVNAAYDAKYIDFNDWLITDKNGIKRVKEVKKYYPSNLRLNIGNDGDDEWTRAGELNTTIQVNDSNLAYVMSDEMNDYLTNTCNNLANNCTIPFVFHSDTHGRLNVSNLNVLVDRKPTVTVMQPNGGESLNGIQTIRWNTADADNDNLVMNVYYLNNTNWILINTTTGLPGVYTYNWNTMTVQDKSMQYNIKISVTDNLSPATNDTSDANFTIDNTLPTINVTNPNGGETSNGNILLQWNANDNIDTNLNISLEYSLDNGVSWNVINAGTNNDGNETWNSVAHNSNQVLIRINATDDAGNMKSDTSDNVFTIDNIKPNIFLINPIDGHNETTNNTVTFYFNTTENINNTLYCELYVNNVIKGNKTVNSGITDNITSTIGDGTFIWAIKCFDGVNSNYSENRTINIDTVFQAPQFKPTSTITKNTALIEVEFNETVSMTYANFSGQIITFNSGDNKTFNYTATGLSNGNYLLIINATDKYNFAQYNHTYVVSIPAATSSGGGGGGSYYCKESWSCTEWGPCLSTNVNLRTCTDSNKCGTDKNKPETQQTCVYEIPFGTFGSNSNLIQEQEEETNEKTSETTEEENSEETGDEKGLEGVTGGVTAGFFDSTTGKVSLGLVVLLVLGASGIIIRNKIRNKKMTAYLDKVNNENNSEEQ